jgi:hypothetical protein
MRRKAAMLALSVSESSCAMRSTGWSFSRKEKRMAICRRPSKVCP